MPATQVSKKFAMLTANGTAAGLITIASNTGWLPGAIAWIVSGTAGPDEVRIVEQVGSTQLRLRKTDSKGQAHGAFNNMTAYLTADNAKISMDQQVVAVQQNFTPRENA